MPNYLVSDRTPTPKRRHIESTCDTNVPLCGFTLNGDALKPAPADSFIQECVPCNARARLHPELVAKPKVKPTPIYTFDLHRGFTDDFTLGALRLKETFIDQIIPPTVPVTRTQKDRYDSGKSIIVSKPKPPAPPKPLHDYKLYFKTGYSWYSGARLSRTVQATDHLAAVTLGAVNSEYGNDSQFIVIGPDDNGTETIRVYKINPVFTYGKRQSDKPVSFTATTSFRGTYNIEEV